MSRNLTISVDAEDFTIRISQPDYAGRVLSFEVSWLQQILSEATNSTVKHANTLVHRAQQYSYEIVMPGIDLPRAVVITISDASPGKMPRQGSQGGMFLMMSTPEITERSVPAVRACSGCRIA